MAHFGKHFEVASQAGGQRFVAVFDRDLILSPQISSVGTSHRMRSRLSALTVCPRQSTTERSVRKNAWRVGRSANDQ